MQLNKQLILFQYILSQLGYEDFEALREAFNTAETGANAAGYSYFAGVLANHPGKQIDNRRLFAYDETIREYEKRLRDNRAEPFFSFKYYQWFSLFFTEYYLDRYVHQPVSLIHSLNTFKEKDKDFSHLEDYTPADLKKLAFWMATGSGKTLIMHCNYWQITKYLKDWENIILITPNEGLSRQHYQSFTASGIAAKQYSGSEESLKTKAGEVLIIEITKLVREKSGEGVTVDVDFFSESKNLVFIDEGHKGQRSEEKKWKSLREHLTRGEGSFTFEYSATFGQIIGPGNKELLQEYGKAILFDYSYRYFYTDGYGKDFNAFNIDVKNNYAESQSRLLLTASLIGFYEQLVLFDQHKEALRPYHIEKPLWVFVGSRVIGGGGSLTAPDKQNISDVSAIIKFFRFALSKPASLQKELDKILSGQSGLTDSYGEDIFKDHFQYLQSHKPVADQIIQKVFHGAGQIEAYQIRQADGEIALKTKTGDHYFAVINIGDVPKYAKKLEEDTGGELKVLDDHFSKSLFQHIAERSSPVNMLIGSKKFIEGWNSWRVSSMGLMNMGKSEGPQIIQLFGRGVRLKGENYSLKREESTAPYYIRALQTISIVGLNASYMNRFLEEIEKEVPEYTEYPIELRFNREEEWHKNIMTFKTEEGRNFKDKIITLSYQQVIAGRISLDLRNKVSVAAGGFNSQVAEDEGHPHNFIKKFIHFIDLNALTLEAIRYRLIRGYTNLLISQPAIEEIIQSDRYELFSYPQQFGLQEAINGQLQNIAEAIVKDYINKFYADQEKIYLSDYLTYETLDYKAREALFPDARKMIVKIPKPHHAVIEELEANIEELYKRDDTTIPSIHFSNHLYSPIASWAKGEKFKEIKTVPVRLNEGERNFIMQLRDFLEQASKKFNEKEVFVLRNLAVRGMGFFIESSSFYPDFIIWVVEKKKQYIYFLDPKGIRETRNFNNAKVIFCRDQVSAIERKINDDLRKDHLDMKVSVQAFILSVTSFNDIAKEWGAGKGTTREEFTKNKILFIEKDLKYMNELFKTLT